MPWSYFIDLQQRTVFSNFTGTITPLDVEEEMNASKNDPQFNPTFNQVVDAFDGKVASDFPTDKVRELGSNTIFDKKSRRAIIVQGDLAFGLARMFATYREINGETSLQVFRNREEAYHWMDVTRPVFPKKETPRN